MNMALSKNEKDFYNKIKSRWSKCSPSVNNILGGYGYTNDSDISESKSFLEKILNMKNGPGTNRVLDCGTGIGRVAYGLLIDYFNCVDAVEQNPTFVNALRSNRRYNKINKVYCSDLQTFFDVYSLPWLYDVIWCQWILENLTNKDVVKFLKSCKNMLNRKAVIIVKENIYFGDEDYYNEREGEITRSFRLYSSLFHEAGYYPILVEKQHNFPAELYKVQMFALRPINF